MVAGLLVWMLRLPEFAPWRGRLALWGPGGWRAGAEMRRIGFAGGAAYFFETVAFASLAQAAGLLGASALAAYTILHNIEALVFMIALGLSVGTAVRIGQAAGAGDRAEARFAGLAGLAAAMGLVALLGLGLFAAAPAVVGFYSADPALIARAAPIIAILAFSMVFDAGQVVLGQSTRALGDGWGTTLCFFAAFFCVMVPLAFFLAFATPLAEAGLFIGTAVGCATAVGLLGARFLHLVGAGLSPVAARSPALSFLAWLPQAALLGIARAAALSRPARLRLRLHPPARRRGARPAPAGRGQPADDLSRDGRGRAPAHPRRDGRFLRADDDRGDDAARLPGPRAPGPARPAPAGRRCARPAPPAAARCSSPGTSASGRRSAPRSWPTASRPAR